MSDNQLATLDSITPDDVLRQIQMVQQLMAKAMKDGTHYGAIPGTGQKKNLLKPGADKLCLMFRLAPTYEVESIDLLGGHREAKVKCTLTQITTGKVFSQGVGSCSTMESKYRYRNDVMTDEDGKPKLVPGKYWQSRDPDILGGQEFSAKKVDGKWLVCRRVEAADLADVYNTVLKMAKKRSYVDATISATAASDIFTQDLEDMPEVVQSRQETPHPSPQPEQIEEQVLEGPLTEIYVNKEWTYGTVKGIEFSTKREELKAKIAGIEDGTLVRVTVKKFVVAGGKTKFRPQSIEVLGASPAGHETGFDETAHGSDE